MSRNIGFWIITTDAYLSPDKLCLKSFDTLDCCGNNTGSSHMQIHDSDTPWKTYLVVLEGNVEDKKPKTPTKGKNEKNGAGEKKSTTKKSGAAAAATTAADGTDGADAAGSPAKTQSDSIVVSGEPVTIPSEWATHGAIALVSHGSLGGITVIHTEMPPGTQIQPIVTTDSTGASVISLDGSSIPFSIPVSMAQPIPLSSEASTISMSVPTLSVPVSDCELASVSVIPTVSTSSVLEAAASQTILAPVSETKATSEAGNLPPDIKTVIVGDDVCRKEQTAAGQQRTEDNPLAESTGAPAPDVV